jgi:ribosomal protein S21
VAESKRKKGETFESFLRRFSKKIQESGIILQVKKIRYHQKMDNKNKRRYVALNRNKIGAKREYLQKIGKLPYDDHKSFGNKKR